MKFVFFTDTHFSSKPPSRYRKGEYADIMMDKYRHLVKAINKHDFAVFGGDWFESHRITDFHLLTRLIKATRRLGKKCFYIWGNHDLDGNSKESRHHSTFGFISRFMPQFVCLSSSMEIEGVEFVPCHAWSKLKRGKKKGGRPRVLVAHKLLTPGVMKYSSHDIGTLRVPFELCLSGDYHGSFVKRYGNTLFANPGSLCRRKKSEKHKPSYLTVSVDGSEFEVKRKVLPHIPYDEAFSDEPVTDNVEDEVNEEELERFVEVVRGLEVGAVDIFDLVRMLKGTVEVDEDVYDYIMTKR